MKNKIVVIGGGTGTFTILSGLKEYSDQIDISVIVSMMDDGGSNRVIRDEFGLLPTSDIRQCMVALASNKADETLRKLFTYRYESGTGISGMTFGNLFMAALTDIYKGNQKKAIEETCKILGVNGKIIPVTYDKTNLVATYESGLQVLGEHKIDSPEMSIAQERIIKLEVFPKAKVNADATAAVKMADMIILGPGDLYTSILPNVVIDNFSSAIRNSKAKLVYILNLMTKYGQTAEFKANDFVGEIKKYIGKRPDVIISNSLKSIAPATLEKYKTQHANLVEDNLNEGVVIRKILISKKTYKKHTNDNIERSLVRHDSKKLAQAVIELL